MGVASKTPCGPGSHATAIATSACRILERTELFVRSIGEVTDIVEKEMYTFVDQLNGESLTLRPEGTASCVRAVLEHHLLYSGPQRLFYTGPMFRHERPAEGTLSPVPPGRRGGAGPPGPDVDAEHMAMCARLWKQLGLDGIAPADQYPGQPRGARALPHATGPVSGAALRARWTRTAAGACTPIRCACWTARTRRCRR